MAGRAEGMSQNALGYPTRSQPSCGSNNSYNPNDMLYELGTLAARLLSEVPVLDFPCVKYRMIR